MDTLYTGQVHVQVSFYASYNPSSELTVDYASFLSPSPVGDHVNISSVWYVMLNL